MIGTIERTETNKATQPPKRWRNRWRAGAVCLCVCIKCGEESIFLRGEIIENHCLTYPSKDVAETEAQREEFGRGSDVYLGAFPVEGA